MASAARFTFRPVRVRAAVVNQSLGNGSRHAVPAIGSQPGTAGVAVAVAVAGSRTAGEAGPRTGEAGGSGEAETAGSGAAETGAGTAEAGAAEAGAADTDATASVRLATIMRRRMRLLLGPHPPTKIPTADPGIDSLVNKSCRIVF
ncbi:hypothetical protein GCM10010156_09380 [Planobispora rosea]|uniref:Uncharacterized protein n=1 Tax=Planobispora rosea TaxID=35762 RepID=A0A8J3WBM6_PLARO|nr:hypothetical protein GCM10010156_09380 [Planobispora rosea]GIH83103.1 hypothetical protein Pro02_15110 [Planobispora rosea]